MYNFTSINFFWCTLKCTLTIPSSVSSTLGEISVRYTSGVDSVCVDGPLSVNDGRHTTKQKRAQLKDASNVY